ncbi:MAG: LysR family transcriptional regulator [Galactobacter sp.]
MATVHQLRCFLAVARERHFTRAAETLGVSPSSLSETVATLEKIVGRRLLERSPRSVALTDAAAELLPLASRTVNSMDRVEDWILGGTTPTLKVGVSVPSEAVDTALRLAAERFPQVHWSPQRVGLGDWAGLVSGGRLDCAFVAEPDVPAAADLEAEIYGSEDAVLLVASGHPLAARTGGVHLAQLGDETFVTTTDTEGSGRWLAPIATALGRHPSTLRSARSFEEVVETVRVGQAVNLAGTAIRENVVPRGLAFIPILDAPKIVHRLYWRRGERSPLIAGLLEIAQGLT